MGIDYSASVSYGFIIPEEELMTISESWDKEEYAYDKVKDLDLLSSDICGDFLGSDSLDYIVFVERSRIEADRNTFGAFRMCYSDLTIEEIDQLHNAAGRFNVPLDSISWIFEHTVS